MICRTCLIEVPLENCFKFSSTNSTEQVNILEMINTCIPELDVFMATEPVICNDCIEQLEKAYSFRKRCLRIEDEIINYVCSTSINGQSRIKINLNSLLNYMHENNTSVCFGFLSKKEPKTEEVWEDIKPGIDVIKASNDEKPIISDLKLGDFYYLNCNQTQPVDYKSVLLTSNVAPIQSLETKPEKVKNNYTSKKTVLQKVKMKKFQVTDANFQDATCTGCYKQSNNPKCHSKVSNGTFICHDCHALYNDVNCIRKHIYKHTKPVICNVCGKRLRDMQQLKVHLISHTEKKTFTCDVCGKSFKQKFALTEHKHIHDPDSILKCIHCLKVCSSKYNLQVHMRIHTGKVYQCEYCSKLFLTNSQRRLHLKKCEFYVDT